MDTIHEINKKKVSDNSCKHLSVNWMAAGSRLLRFEAAQVLSWVFSLLSPCFQTCLI